MIYLDRIDTRPSHGDITQLFSWRNNPAVYMYCRQFAPLHWDDHKRWLEKQVTDKNIEMFAIRHKTNLVGCCGLTDIDYINRRAEFSLYIDPSKHGCGYGTKALKELFTVGFNAFNLNLIWGESYSFNKANDLFKKIGMTKEGARRFFYYRNGNYIDAYLWSISKDEFNGQ